MTKYPAQIDTSVELPTAVDNQTKILAKLFNRLRDAIIAVESELGTRPSGSYSTVKGRFNTLESSLNNLSLITLAKDLGGTLSLPKVIGIQGNPVSDGYPENKNVLMWNGIAWEPGIVNSLVGDEVDISATSSLNILTEDLSLICNGSALLSTDGYLTLNIGTVLNIAAPTGIKMSEGPLYFDGYSRLVFKYATMPDSDATVSPGYIYSGGTSQLSSDRTYTLSTSGYTIKAGDFIIISNRDSNNTITLNYPGGGSTSIGPSTYCKLINTNGSTSWLIIDKHSITVS